MGYGRLGSTESESQQPEPHSNQQDDGTSRPLITRRTTLKLLLAFSTAFIVASVVSVGLLVGLRTRAPGESEAAIRGHPTVAISRTCSKTRFPTLCVNSLIYFPGALSASERDLVHISVNMTLQRFGKALYFSSEISNLAMDSYVRSAYEDCLELLEDSVYQLSRSLTSVAFSPDGNAEPAGSTHDVLTWLSAALTNHDTCTDGLAEVSGYVKNRLEERLSDLSELVSNCLAIYSATAGDEDFAGVPIQNRRRRLMESNGLPEEHSRRYPKWLSRRERALLDIPVAAIQADIVVSKDGNGTCKTIAEAIKKAPEYSNRRTIIYVRAGK